MLFTIEEKNEEFHVSCEIIFSIKIYINDFKLIEEKKNK